MSSNPDGNDAGESAIKSKINFVLREQCKVCERCIHQIVHCRWISAAAATAAAAAAADAPTCTSCTVCLGVQSDEFLDRTMDEIRSKFEIYGGLDAAQVDDDSTAEGITDTDAKKNLISKDAPTVAIPIHIAIRIQCLVYAIADAIMGSGKPIHSIVRGNSSDIYTKMKDSVRNRLRARLTKLGSLTNTNTNTGINETIQARNNSYLCFEGLDSNLLSILRKEESGYMNCHMIIQATMSVQLPTNIITLPQSKQRSQRKRFRGNDPTFKQGGCPLENLSARLKADLKCQVEDESMLLKDGPKQSLNASISEKSVILQVLDNLGRTTEKKKQLGEWIVSQSACNNSFDHEEAKSGSGSGIELCIPHVAAWRHAIYLKGRYTKARRDVSQTPFYVPCDENEKDKGNGNGDANENKNSNTKDEPNSSTNKDLGNSRLKKLGITSIEEEITPIVSSIACGGISKQNNECKKDGNWRSANVVYGMTKFHASGREDMNVRMVLPMDAFEAEKESIQTSKGVQKTGSGRPFVLEILDAMNMPEPCNLKKTVHEINRVTSDSDIASFGISEGTGDWVEEPERKHVQYGKNPKGVGISGLTICSSSSFKQLQNETEDKVKFYGCLCWSEKAFANQKSLEDMLVKGESMYPLEIKQSTPLRVLHRRSAAVRVRHVLSMVPYRINDHYFRLSMSTSAGTYVKEFCHGDCGRTSPSVSSLLGCKTDILELD
eukprot:CAMPEP_0194078488 /NCGR_PEP_ID=MMETSP0149-20130528/4867_1 /TAXON_ID=122233 /ORGANISM="Chaetoceros debilis, Strain MM31A-1" /LENGTH=718 /DNA_ID=CAMNT_0038759763 /DNA_START=28 /DNA_END=2181 /DNA_ORIENTATION=+